MQNVLNLFLSAMNEEVVLSTNCLHLNLCDHHARRGANGNFLLAPVTVNL